MSITIGASATKAAWLTPVASSLPLLPKSAGFSDETKSQSASVSISDRAKVANAALSKWDLETNGTAYSQDFFKKIDSLQGQDKIDAYTDAAMQVSADQGLPPGHFDFSHMTRGQALVVANYEKLTANSDADRSAADSMISALNDSFGGSTSFTTSTFDVRQLLTTASASDSGDAKGYDAAIGLIDKLNQHWTDTVSGSAGSSAVTTVVNPDGTTTASVTSATYTT